MAKPKCDVLIERFYPSGMLAVYCDQPARQAIEIKSIEGVSEVTIWPDKLWVYVSPRYHLDEIAAKIEDLLIPINIPEAFLDSDS